MCRVALIQDSDEDMRSSYRSFTDSTSCLHSGMTFDEASVNRSTTGQFSEKRGSSAEISLRPPEVTYHRDIGIPSNVTVPQRVVKCEYIGHADRERYAEKYGHIPRLDEVDLAAADVVEVAVSEGRVSKLLVRVPHPTSERDDIVMVLRPGETKKHPWTVVTNWVNRKNDKHSTLDRSKYADPAAA